ncbi:MAG: hypothetical protein ACRED5_07595 [Propylenella sp.]
MRRAIRVLAPLGLLLACAVALSACQTALRGLAPFDPLAVQRTAEIKVETESLMRQSGERFSRHASEVDDLTKKVEAAFEVARATPNNQFVAQQWAIMKDPEGGLYGGFMKRWREGGTIGDAFREEKTAQIARGFDLILCLENAKRQPIQCDTGGGQ